MTELTIDRLLPKRQRQEIQKKELVPRVVQPGARLPSLHRDVTDVWTPLFPGTRERDKKEETEQEAKLSDRSVSSRQQKYKNLFEYKQRHKADFGLKTNLWKIPNYSRNVLPTSTVEANDSKSKMKISGLYEQNFQRWYGRLVHENTVILPPIETSVRAKENVFDSTNLTEKKYVMKDKIRTGNLEKFASDEMYLPDVYGQFFTCKECRSNYVKDMFGQRSFKRHKTVPITSRENTRFYKSVAEKQHCDVLGERYCRSCIEKRNKVFFREIEDQLLSVKDLSKIHYK